MAATFPLPTGIPDEASPSRAAPPMRPQYLRETSYSGQNSWMSATDRSTDYPNVTRSMDGGYRSNLAPLKRPTTGMSPNSQYFDQYMKLMNRMAYRYPNPGPPKLRNGNVGANWRHIRQVQGYGGNHICFIDGVVKQYDLNNMNQELAGKRPPNKATPLYAVNMFDVNGYKDHVAMEAEKQSYKPWQPSLPPIAGPVPHYYN